MLFCLLGRDCGISGGTTYLLMLAEGLVQCGHRVTLAAGGGRALPCFRNLGADHVRLLPGIFGQRRLAGFIHKYRPDAVICSGRGRSLRMARAAAQLEGTRSICVLQDHLTEDQTASSFDGIDRIVAVEAPIHEQALALGVEPTRLHLWPRPVRSRTMVPLSTDPVHVLWMGRLSGNKVWSAEALVQAAPTLLQTNPDLRISIIGGGSGARRVRRSAAAVNRRCGRRVIDVRGFTLDPLSELEQASIVVGGGYTCLEAVYNGRPAIGAGFGWYGRVDRDGLCNAYNAHFGDRYCEPCGASLVALTTLGMIEALREDSEHSDIIGHRGWFELDHDPGAHARRMGALVAELSE